ncbi:hypothetical protein DOY81_008428 [Sarcophaga bullata]|nr:hypothetical protein DOY81_008428 [Sarcophaga bullata]
MNRHSNKNTKKKQTNETTLISTAIQHLLNCRLSSFVFYFMHKRIPTV